MEGSRSPVRSSPTAPGAASRRCGRPCCSARAAISSRAPSSAARAPRSPQGTITLTKHLLPAADPGRFDLKLDAATRAAAAGDGGTSGPVSVPVGNHAVSESAVVPDEPHRLHERDRMQRGLEPRQPAERARDGTAVGARRRGRRVALHADEHADSAGRADRLDRPVARRDTGRPSRSRARASAGRASRSTSGARLRRCKARPMPAPRSSSRAARPRATRPCM